MSELFVITDVDQYYSKKQGKKLKSYVLISIYTSTHTVHLSMCRITSAEDFTRAFKAFIARRRSRKMIVQ